MSPWNWSEIMKKSMYITCVTFFVTTTFRIIFGGNEKRVAEWEITEFSTWLDTNGLQLNLDFFEERGVHTLPELLSLDTETNPLFKNKKLQYATSKLQEQIKLAHWLQTNDMETFIERLFDADLLSFQDIHKISESKLHKFFPEKREREFIKLIKSAYQNEKHTNVPVTYNSSKDIYDLLFLFKEIKENKCPIILKILWYPLKVAKHCLDLVKKAYNFVLKVLTMFQYLAIGTALFVSISAAWWMRESEDLENPQENETRQIATTGNRHVLTFFTGYYLNLEATQVIWESKDPLEVGNTLTLVIKFFQWNGAVYPISEKDLFHIQIKSDSVTIEPFVEIGGKCKEAINRVKVEFTVFTAENYRFSISVKGKHIPDSPFEKFIYAGPVDISKFELILPCSVMVAEVNSTIVLRMKARDAYGNKCKAYETVELMEIENYNLALQKTGTDSVTALSFNVTDLREDVIILATLQEEEGCFDATLAFKSQKLKDGDFTILVLNAKELKKVQKTVKKRIHNIYFESRLLNSDNLQDKGKKVFCFVSPKQFTIVEYHLLIFSKKLYTFRVCPTTKILFQGSENKYGLPMFTIEDPCQAPVHVASKDRNRLAAIFTSFLLDNIGGSNTFEEKRKFFNKMLLLEHAERGGRIQLKINRTKFWHSSYKAVKDLSNSDWFKKFEVEFKGEDGLDWGGIKKEWFELFCVELFDPSASGLFMSFDNSSQAPVHPNPDRPAHLTLHHYEIAGKIVGKCLYDSAKGLGYSHQVKAKFTRSFLTQILGFKVDYKFLENDDPELYNTKVKYIEQNDVEDMDLTFSEDVYKDGKLKKIVDLIPGGRNIPVTNGNKFQYLNSLVQYKLVQVVTEEVNAFLKGLFTIVPGNLLSLFDENELELLMCGLKEYSLADFRKNHEIIGSKSEASLKVRQWFWTVISSFTNEQMAKLLQFSTGSSLLPPGGFSELKPIFQIELMPRSDCLPISHTCFNMLCLPHYESLEQFHQSLLFAINEGNQGFAFA